MIVAKAIRLLGFIGRSCAGIVGSVALLRRYCMFISAFALLLLLSVMGTSVCYQQFILSWKSAKRSYTPYAKNSSKLSYKDRLIKLKLLPLNYWLEYLDLVFSFKCLHGHVDLTRSFNYYFSFVTGQRRQTRQACSGLKLKINNNRTSTFRDSILIG